MKDLGQTQYFKVEKENSIGVKEILSQVYEALSEKGYARSFSVLSVQPDGRRAHTKGRDVVDVMSEDLHGTFRCRHLHALHFPVVLTTARCNYS